MSVLKGTSPDNSLDRWFLRSAIDFVLLHGRREKNQRLDRHRDRRYPFILLKRAVDRWSIEFTSRLWDFVEKRAIDHRLPGVLRTDDDIEVIPAAAVGGEVL